jgi:hypothetical protein
MAAMHAMSLLWQVILHRGHPPDLVDVGDEYVSTNPLCYVAGLPHK